MSAAFADAKRRYEAAGRGAGPWTATGPFHAERRDVADKLVAAVESNGAYAAEDERWRWRAWPLRWEGGDVGPGWTQAHRTRAEAQAAADASLRAAGWALYDEPPSPEALAATARAIDYKAAL